MRLCDCDLSGAEMGKVLYIDSIWQHGRWCRNAEYLAGVQGRGKVGARSQAWCATTCRGVWGAALRCASAWVGCAGALGTAVNEGGIGTDQRTGIWEAEKDFPERQFKVPSGWRWYGGQVPLLRWPPPVIACWLGWLGLVLAHC